MKDYIQMERIWQDEHLFKMKIECVSEFVDIINCVYTSNECIDDLIDIIRKFLRGKVSGSLWENGERGDDSSAYISMEFLYKDKLGHIQIEVYMEIEDGGKFSKHNCCFYVNTEIGLLTEFCQNLSKLKNTILGEKVILNRSNFDEE